MEEQLVTMATVEDDEGAVVMTRPKKKSSSDQALEKFALATVAKSITVYPCRVLDLEEIDSWKNNSWTKSLYNSNLDSTGRSNE